jgi:hemerythrin-like metal-binding protein
MEIQRVEWKKDYSVNVEEIDTQHKKLFSILNILIENKKISVNSKIVTKTLTEMTEYADYHFKTEEEYMEKYEYPELNEHKKEHREFIRKTGQLILGAMEKDTTIPDEILNYLNEWLVNHILISDLKLKPFFLEKNVT